MKSCRICENPVNEYNFKAGCLVCSNYTQHKERLKEILRSFLKEFPIEGENEVDLKREFRKMIQNLYCNVYNPSDYF